MNLINFYLISRGFELLIPHIFIYFLNDFLIIFGLNVTIFSTFTQTLWFFISLLFALPHRLLFSSLKLLQTHQKQSKIFPSSYFPWLLFHVSIRLSTIDFVKHKTSNAFFVSSSYFFDKQNQETSYNLNRLATTEWMWETNENVELQKLQENRRKRVEFESEALYSRLYSYSVIFLLSA